VSDQLPLDFERPPHQGPIVPTGEVDKLIEKLAGRGWMTAEQLGATTESQKRSLRAVGEESEGQIISGQKGYKLTIEATEAELNEVDWWRSQGKKMVRRWAKTRRVWHQHHPDQS
jgi:hypothetical protein